METIAYARIANGADERLAMTIARATSFQRAAALLSERSTTSSIVAAASPWPAGPRGFSLVSAQPRSALVQSRARAVRR
jgi:hypothetical protein